MYAHYSFGGKVFRVLPKSVRDMVKRNKEIYLIGLQGPDILFYYKPLSKNPISSYGHAMHEKPASEFFTSAGRNYLENGREEAVLVYLLGFICHFTLDSTCHGYIEKKIETDGVCHTEIEVEFDRYLMTEDGFDPLTYRTSSSIMPSEENARIIGSCFDGITPAQVYKALKSMVFYSNALVAPGKIKRTALYAGLKAAGKFDPLHHMIISREAAPECADSCMRLSKLMDKRATDLAARLIANYLEYLKSEDELDPWFDKTFGPGEGWQDIKICTAEEEEAYEV